MLRMNASHHQNANALHCTTTFQCPYDTSILHYLGTHLGPLRRNTPIAIPTPYRLLNTLFQSKVCGTPLHSFNLILNCQHPMVALCT